ncbi:MAG: hypothetical protein HKP61_00440 [Dactylosporangium sp.]|nr:hypothetical protein [Dactylosporangium sp.]NNJ59440.1 hypothetical protein [Dactylosporangium sp.]
MTPGDSVRLRHPLRDFEERLATVIETAPGPCRLNDDQVLLEFPSGERLWYPVAATIPHDALADQTIVLNALGHAYRLLQRIEDVAWDTDEELGDLVTITLASVHDTVYGCLNVNLDNDSCLSPPVGTQR